MQPTPFLPVTYLDANAAARPDQAALVDGARTVTFAELKRHVDRAVARLQQIGLKEGEPVAVQLSNRWEYPALELAIPHAGGIVMPLPLTLGEAELDATIRRSGAALLVTGEPEQHAAAREVAASIKAVRAALTIDDVFEGRSPLRRPLRRPSDPERVVEIALTSGTTGMPKLAALTAGLKQATFEGFTGRLQVRPDDRVLVMSPLMQGIGGFCLLALRLGAALVLVREPRFTPESTLAEAARSRATMLVGVPTNLIRMLASPALDEARLDALGVTAVAGSPMSPEVAQAWERRTGARVCIFYGSMDAGQLAVASPDDPPEKRWHTVGRPHDSCQAQICDQRGRPLKTGRIGEICMRGPTVQKRYWGEADGPLAPDGWAHMGDLGFIDEDGYLHVVGRLKDIVIRGGTNINPYEVENALRPHPSLADVCVVGHPDPELGERVHAVVVARQGQAPELDDLRRFLHRRGIARYKWPEFISIVDEIPLLGPGKVNRRAVEEMAR